MTTVQAFNEMMGQFLDELVSTFPEEEAFKTAQAAPRTRATFDDFMKKIGPHASHLMAKSPDFFSEQNEFVKGLNLHVVWGSPDATSATKDAIWQYIQTMYILGNTISMFPPETLSMIEAAAENCAKNMKTNGSGQMDEKAMMAGMNNMLSQMMGGAGGGGLAALLGGGLQQQQAPRPKAKSKGRKK
jgi:ornithine carbamoyltransferase